MIIYVLFEVADIWERDRWFKAKLFDRKGHMSLSLTDIRKRLRKPTLDLWKSCSCILHQNNERAHSPFSAKAFFTKKFNYLISRFGLYPVLVRHSSLRFLFISKGQIRFEGVKIWEYGIVQRKNCVNSQQADRSGHPALLCTAVNSDGALQVLPCG